ncbi:shikimate dehydrogenase [Acidocella sp.]|uniref:shikimate dehydrogenase n=1 Tax=Acidocella sp. TaxID=50710 RepID=UPI00260CC58F|nr:shikimate dehydrogenase [Acidocella sp.]
MTTPATVPALGAPVFKLGLIGADIGPSRSPAMHMGEGRAQGLALTYDLFDLTARALSVADLPALLTEIEGAGYRGVNVTHPCKQAVMPLLDTLSPEAQALGAVNTVLFENGRRLGHNTDWYGFSESFTRGLQGANLHHAVQLGAGGAGTAVAYALLKMGVKTLTLIDADPARAEAIAVRYGALFGHGRIQAGIDATAALATATGLVNATPIGMAAHPGLPLDAALLRPDLWVAEIIYFPRETALLKAAKALGCRTLDGTGMALYQAVQAFRLFTGREPDPARMLEIQLATPAP